MGRKIWQFIKGSIFVLSAIFIGLIISMVIIIGKEENTLSEELIEFYNKDLSTDNYKISIKTKGDYAYVEKTVKQFYKDLSDNIKELDYNLNDTNFVSVLSVNQLQKNRPDYTYNHKIIKDTKSKINKAIDNINNLCDEEYIKKLFDKSKVPDELEEHFYNLFLEYVYDEENAIMLENTKKEVMTLSKQINELLDKLDEILVFLNKNDDTLVINKDSISFEDEDVQEEYQKLYIDIIKIGIFNMTTDTEEKDKL